MAIDTDQRPVFLTLDTFNQLEKLRGFRHFVRNAYTYTLDGEKVLVLAEGLTTCSENLYNDFIAFKRFFNEPS